MNLSSLNYGIYGIFLIMGHAGFISSTVGRMSPGPRPSNSVDCGSEDEPGKNFSNAIKSYRGLYNSNMLRRKNGVTITAIVRVAVSVTVRTPKEWCWELFRLLH